MIEFFKGLSEKELTSLRRFVHSPYFNRNNSVIKLFELLESLYPEISKKDLSHENISAVIFAGQSFDKSRIRKLISDFSDVMERFLMQEEISKNVVANRIALLRVLRKKGMSKRFEMESKILAKLQKQSFSKDDNYYLNQINLENEIYLFGLNNHKAEYADYIKKIDELCDCHFAFQKLHLFNSMHPYETEHNKKFGKNFYEQILHVIEKNKKNILKNHPNIYVIYLVVKMNSSGDDKFLHELMSFLNRNGSKFPSDKLSYYYHYIRAYFVNRIEHGNTEYRKDFLKLIKHMHSKNLLLIDDMLTDMEFNSIVNNALPMGEYDWLEEFVEEYKTFLDPKFAHSAYNLAKAKIEYYRKNYERIFHYLKELNHSDPVYYLNAKYLLGRAYYEEENYDSARYIVKNLKQYMKLSRNLTPLQKTITTNYTKFLSGLLKLRDTFHKDVKGESVLLKKELDNEKNHVPSKQWFYDMLLKLR